MKIIASNDFLKSFKKLIDSYSPWKWEFWRQKYYDLKLKLWALRKYFKTVTMMTPWDSQSIIIMLKFQIEILSNYLEKRGHEEEKSKLSKVTKMKRFVELANNYLEDNYLDRCEFIHRDMKFVPVEGEKDLMELKFDETPEEAEHNAKALQEIAKLQEKEWKEMIGLLKYMRGWWD
jgi:hypothetical protein